MMHKPMVNHGQDKIQNHTKNIGIMQDYLKQIFEAFGPTRMFWGTDISKMPCNWSQCVTQFTEELDWLRGDDLTLVMGQAICDWWGWERG